MVADVEIRGERVRVVLALRAVGAIRADLDVAVEITEMGVAEWEAFLARIQEEQSQARFFTISR